MSGLYLNHTIPELVLKIESGCMTHLDLAMEVEKQINEFERSTLCWVNYDFNKLKREAMLDHSNFIRNRILRPLEGMPFGLKDIFNTKEYPTEMGSALWKNYVAGNNARVVDSLIGAGGLIAGKTVTAEFAIHALNQTLNPHDPAKTPGTSSSGSAAAVAVGMIPASLATQTAGSIIRPGSFCGVWGMKPSFGMVPRTGVLKTTDSLDTIGIIAAHGKSLRPILDVIRVKGPNYPFVYKHVDKNGALPKKLKRPWRVGFVKTRVWSEAESYAKNAVEKFVDQLNNQVGFEVNEIILPRQMENSHRVHDIIYRKSVSYYFKNENKSKHSLSPIMAEMIEAGEKIKSEQYKSALEEQEQFCIDLDRLFDKYDFVVSLATSSSAPDRGVEEIPDPSLMWTLGHLPSIVAPAFRCPDGLPFGVQFTAQRWSDYLLLQGIEELIDIGALMGGSMPVLK